MSINDFTNDSSVIMFLLHIISNCGIGHEISRNACVPSAQAAYALRVCTSVIHTTARDCRCAHALKYLSIATLTTGGTRTSHNECTSEYLFWPLAPTFMSYESETKAEKHADHQHSINIVTTACKH